MRNSASVFESSLSFDRNIRELLGVSPSLGRHKCAPRTSRVQHFSWRVQHHLYGADGQLLKPGANTHGLGSGPDFGRVTGYTEVGGHPDLSFRVADHPPKIVGFLRNGLLRL